MRCFQFRPLGRLDNLSVPVAHETNARVAQSCAPDLARRFYAREKRLH